MELLRRILFYGCGILAVAAFIYASLEPYVVLSIHEPEDYKKGSFSKHLESLLPPEEWIAIQKKRQDEIIESTIDVQGREWLEIYKNLKAHRDRNILMDSWKKRLPGDQYPTSSFFYRTTDTPIISISNRLISEKTFYLRLAKTKDREDKTDSLPLMLSLSYVVPTDDNFALGSGYSRYPRPPTWMLYPYRQYSLYIFLFGLASYIFLPVSSISPNAIRYPRWRVISGDIAATLLFFPFFSLPFLISGGLIQAVTVGFPITIPMWLISLLGLYSIKIALWYGSYQIDIKDDGLT
ncbi:MAG: hypothetical protein SNJ53_03710, partial [Thermodesulfovibrionales bacterium]